MQHFPNRRHVVVVGAGIIGCATAYRLARAGFAVSLVERDAIAAHASGRNAGNLNPLHETPPTLVRAAVDAFHLHRAVREELHAMGCGACEARPVERIFLARDATASAGLEALAALYESTEGFSATWLPAEELRRREPRLAADIRFGLLTRGALTIDSGEYARCLARAAARYGTTIMQATVDGAFTTGERVTALHTQEGTIPCDEVVFATGPWSDGLRTWLGIELAVEPVKGELLLMRLPGAPIGHDLTLERACLYRRREDEVWVGGTMQRCGLDCRPTTAGREGLLNLAAAILPDMGGAQLIEHIAALRPMPRSGRPIAEAAPGWQNVYLANGGGSKGVLYSVGIADTILTALMDSRTKDSRVSIA